MLRIFLLLTLLYSLNHATEYPKPYAQLGTPLFEADKLFIKYQDLPNMKDKVRHYHYNSKELLELGYKIEKDPKRDKKKYILGLRSLQKEHDDLIHTLHGNLLHTIDTNDYDSFKEIVTIGGDMLFSNRIILKRSMAYYVTYRTRGAIDALETAYLSLSSDADLFEYVKGHMPRVHLIKSFFSDDGVANELRVSNNERYAYVANGDYCLKVLDIRNFNQTSEISNYSFSDESCQTLSVEISADQHYLYVSDPQNGFSIIDISEPNALFLRGNYSPFKARKSVITPDGKFSFVIHMDKGMSILDISTKSEIKLKANFHHGLKINALALDMNRSRAYIGHTEGFSILDISDIQNPREIFTTPIIEGVNDIVLSDNSNLVYLACGDAGIKVYNISNDDAGKQLSTCLTPAYVHHLHRYKHTLYASALNDGVYTIDAHSPHELKHVSTYKLDQPKASAFSAQLNSNDDTLYIAYGKHGIVKARLQD